MGKGWNRTTRRVGTDRLNWGWRERRLTIRSFSGTEKQVGRNQGQRKRKQPVGMAHDTNPVAGEPWRTSLYSRASTPNSLHRHSGMCWANIRIRGISPWKSLNGSGSNEIERRLQRRLGSPSASHYWCLQLRSPTIPPSENDSAIPNF